MSGYPVGDNYFKGKIYCNLVPTDKKKLPMTEFFTFYDNVQADGVSAIYPHSGYVPESCEQERRGWNLVVTTDPLTLNIYDTAMGVIKNDIGKYRRENGLNTLGQHIPTPQSVIDTITKRVMQNIDVVSPTEYRFKQRIIKNGVDETLSGKRRYASNINAEGYNIYLQSGLMAYIGRHDLQEGVNPSVGQFVNKMVGIVTGYSTVEGREEWDKKYVDAINDWLVDQGLPKVSELTPLYFDFERCSYTFVGSTHKEKPHIYQDSFTE
jgi:hypothetical protein